MHSTVSDRASCVGALERKQNSSHSPLVSAADVTGAAGLATHTIRTPVNGTNASNDQTSSLYMMSGVCERGN